MTTKLDDLKYDEQNARRHPEPNRALLRSSLAEVGAARSIVIDEDDAILAGNGVVAAARDLGLSKLKVVDVDGETLVAVRRTGLSPLLKERLKLYDNESALLAEWDAAVIAELLASQPEALAGILDDNEIARIVASLDVTAPSDFAEYDENLETSYCCPKCGYEWSGKPR